MSDSPASLRRKIDGAAELQSVVRTMKAMAASKIGHYEASVRALADYARTVELGLGVCLRNRQPLRERATGQRPAARPVVGAVVFGSDQGLVGRFNEVVADFATTTLKALSDSIQVWAVGGRVHSHLVQAGLPVVRVFRVPAAVKAITPLVGKILIETEARYSQGGINELFLVFNRPTSGPVFAPVSQRLLPMDASWRETLAALPWPTQALPEVLGDGAGVLSALVHEYLFVSLFRACAESLASENASRLAAMQRADKNIEEMLDNLKRNYHRWRQRSIDEELFDVIAGFEALSSEGRKR